MSTVYSQSIHQSRYARWVEELGRRETYEETVDRFLNFFNARLLEKSGYDMAPVRDEIRGAMLTMDVMPSMRALMTAGPALERENVGAYNCAFLPIDHPASFSELLYVLMNGTGSGYSIQSRHVNRLPEIPDELFPTQTVLKVRDSKMGWAIAVKELVGMLYAGQTPEWDLSKVRPAGAPLKTFGGRACLTGDTRLFKDRKKSRDENTITIKQLFDIQEKERAGKWRGRFKKIRIRSLDENTGMFFRNKIIEVIDNGEQNVYEVITETGYKIRATDNHRFMSETGEYCFLSKFTKGDMIAVNGSPEQKTGKCIDCDIEISRRAIRCKSCYDVTQRQDDCKDTTARARHVCRLYYKTHSQCEKCNKKCNHDNDNTTQFIVHHIDHNPKNNSNENLHFLCSNCHMKTHAQEDSFGDNYSCKYLCFDKIKSITYVGVEKVYDIAMKGPNHNFIANGFVSHNSGPAPLDDALRFITAKFKHAKGRKLTPLECHDICCKIGEVVVVGGVRRSALIALFDKDDRDMRTCKSGAWWESTGYRHIANNSAVYESRPSVSSFLSDWKDMIDGNSGEPGLHNIYATRKHIEKHCPLRKLDDANGNLLPGGANPCHEIALRAYQFCNLTMVTVRPHDTPVDIKKKIELATILGTFQATLTDFKFLRKIWKTTTEDEALLGVTLTGVQDNPHTSINAMKSSPHKMSVMLESFKEVAVETNRVWADTLGIKQSASVTSLKPSGNSGALVGASSGIHAAYAPYYIRRVRQDVNDPLAKFMIDKGFPYEVAEREGNTVIFSFPMKSSATSVTEGEFDSVDAIDYYLMWQRHYTTHMPSCTVHVKDDEWLKVGSYVYDHFDEIMGIAFLPKDDNTYIQAPFEECTKEAYDEMVRTMPNTVDWKELGRYETSDMTNGSQELACSAAGGCEV